MDSAKIIINSDYKIGKPDDMLFGSFIEHLGRAVYGGIYEPGHATADEDGFRGDVMGLIRELNVSGIRYPGGNFVSGYNWEDGVGERSKRKKTVELAWRSTEPNEIGTDEFLTYCRKLNTEPIMAVNLGTAGINQARNLIEYCNFKGGTYYSDKRIANGFEKPHGVKYWCLGNEMDGEWQIGHKTAVEYARLANETAKVMRQVDGNIKLVACGSSSRGMRTFPEWENTVLTECYDTVDCISLHTYFGNGSNDTGSFVAENIYMEEFINEVIAVCDSIKAKKRSKKTMMLSFDEYNVWFHSHGAKFEEFSVAPPILEDIYTAEDAVCLGGMLITLLRCCARVKIACLAQLVNVIAPIMTATGGGSWRQTIFYPFLHFSTYGRGDVMNVLLTSPKYTCKKFGDIDKVDSIAVTQPDGSVCVFAVNRSETDSTALDIELQKFELNKAEHTALYSNDKSAVNTLECPMNVTPRKAPNDCVRTDSGFRAVLPPLSWNVIKIF